MKARSFTVPARKHRGQYSLCEDAAVVQEFSASSVSMCVADGVGSASRSGDGARLIATLISSELLGCAFDTDHVRDGLRRARQEWIVAIEGLARRPRQWKLSDYAATVAFAIAKPGQIIVGAIGDCFAVAMRDADAPEFYLVVDQGRVKGQFMSETTTFSQTDWESHLRIVKVVDPSLNGLLISTDGLEAVGVRHARVDTDDGRPERIQIDVQLGVIDRLLCSVHQFGTSSEDMASAIAANTELMRSKGDDIGVALAVW
jgi:hypothetical protein